MWETLQKAVGGNAVSVCLMVIFFFLSGLPNKLRWPKDLLAIALFGVFAGVVAVAGYLPIAGVKPLVDELGGRLNELWIMGGLAVVWSVIHAGYFYVRFKRNPWD